MNKNLINGLVIMILVLFGTVSVQAAGLTINPGLKVDVNDTNLKVQGTFKNDGTLIATAGTVTVTGDWSSSGVFTPGNGSVEFSASSGAQTLDLGGSGSEKSFFNLVHSGAGSVILSNGGFIDINGKFINSNGTFDTAGKDMFVAGSWVNSGSYLHKNNLVTLDGTNQNLLGNTTFFALSKKLPVTVTDTLTFDKTGNQSITNTLVLQGTSGNPLLLRSNDVLSPTPVQFNISLNVSGTQTLSFLDVKDSDASGGVTLVADSTSKDSGNNTNWVFAVPRVTPTPTPVPTPPDGGGPGPTPIPTLVPARGGSVVGNVADSKLRPVARIFVDAFDFFNGTWVNSGRTDTFGNYEIANLPAGTYKIGVDVDGTAFVEQFFDNADWISAKKVVVTEAVGRGGINFVLQQDNFIRGRVIDRGGVPISGLFVDAFNSITREWVNDGVTDGQGDYSIPVPPGSYKLAVNTFGTDFISKFYVDGRTFEEATDVDVTSNRNALNINFTLSTGNAIKGRVTDSLNNSVSGMFVSVFDIVTEKFVSSALTDENGNYSISVLAGRYNVVAEVNGTNFLEAIRENVIVTDDTESPVINFILSIANSIKGKVVDDLNAPLPGFFIEVLSADTNAFVNFGVSDVNGDYSVPVLAGSYKVVVNTFGTDFIEVSKNVSISISDIIVDFNLTKDGLIRGNVSDNSNKPVVGLAVNAYDFNDEFWVVSGETDINGDYFLSVTPGIYKIGVDTTDTDFAPQFYDNTDRDDANDVVVSSKDEIFNIDFILTNNSFISGNVKGDDKVIKDVILDVFDFDSGTWVNSSQTSDGGNYKVPVIPGNYKIGTYALKQGFTDEFYDDRSFEGANSIRIVPGETKSRIDFDLKAGGTISGKVTNGSVSIVGIEVNAFDYETNVWVNSAVTDSNGNYKIDGLSSGNYLLWAFDPVSIAFGSNPVSPSPPSPAPVPEPGPVPAPGPVPGFVTSSNIFRDFVTGFATSADRPSGRYVSRFYIDSTSREQTVPVKVISGGNVVNINIELILGGTVSGKVTDKNGNGMEGVSVDAYETDTGIWIVSVLSDSSGNYNISLSANKDYKLKVSDPKGVFSQQYFNGVPSWNRATSVAIKTAADVSGVNFVLTDEGNLISGLVSNTQSMPVRGIEVGIFDFDTEVWISSGLTDSNGKYSIFVKQGKYRVGVLPSGTSRIPVFYDNVSSWNDALPIFVTNSQKATNVNFIVDIDSKIEGKVIDKSNNPLPRVTIQVFDFKTNSWVNEGVTDTSGNFSVAVPGGKYRIRSVPMDNKSGLSSEFYNNELNWDFADPVEVENDTVFTLNDIILSEGVLVSGTVLNEDSVPLPDTVIDVFDFDTGSWVNSAVTNNEGKFVVSGLPRADYRFKALPPQDNNAAGMFYSNSSDWDGAKRISVGSVNVENINFTLANGGYIKGKTFDVITSAGVGGVEVSAYEFSSGRWVNSDITDGNGIYSIQVPEATYLVRANTSGTDYAEQFFDSTVDLDKAKPAVVTVNRDYNANFKLIKAATITGIIENNLAIGIPGAIINVYDFNSNVWVNSGLTDSTGEFSINLPTGVYRFGVKAPIGTDFIDEKIDVPLEVTAPDEVILAGVVLSEGRGSIVGSVKDSTGLNITGMKVSVFDFVSDNLVGSSFTNASGNYIISVPPGRYRVKTFASGSNASLVDELFDNVVNWVDASSVNVSKGVIRTADFILDKGSLISGRVKREKDLTPVAGAVIHVFQADTALWVTSVKTDGNGYYTLNVADGVYKLWAVPGDSGFVPQFFSITTSFDKAKSIVVRGATVNGVNFDLVSN